LDKRIREKLTQKLAEQVDPVTGNTALTIPQQLTLRYDAQGRFLASGPARP
jgi:hypothetical protein